MQGEKELFALYQSKTNRVPVRAKRLGGGYYADVYRLHTANDVCPDVVKIYKTEGVMARECAALSALCVNALVPMPKVLWTHIADANYPFDVMAMDYLSGENGGGVYYFSKHKRKQLAEQVADNLLAWHNTVNLRGFGTLHAEVFSPSWQTYYYERAQEILQMAEEMYRKDLLPADVLQTMQSAVQQFEKIFYLPIARASLIHGDYNMWNVLVDKKTCTVTGVIDPGNCLWADSEMDLYQLNNANGKHLDLLSAYAKKCPLSENFREKYAFYELFTEIEHYYHSGHSIDKKRVCTQTKALKKFL